MSDFTYDDLRAYILKETADRDAGTYYSMGGSVMLKIEDQPEHRTVWYNWHGMKWEFIFKKSVPCLN